MYEEKFSQFLSGIKNTQTGYSSISFGDVLYEQIVPYPSTINFGRLTSDKEMDSQLWNSYREVSRTLNDYFLEGEGLVTLDLTTPKTFQPMEYIEFKVKAIASESIILNTKLTYNFTEETINPFQRLIGSALYIFKPHWDFNRLNSENFQYYTSLHKAYDGTEHRIQMVDNPRFNILANYILISDERREFESFVYERLGDEMGMPLFSELTFSDTSISSGATEILCDTKYSILQAGQLAFLISGNKNEIVEIKEVLIDRIVLQNPVSNSYEIDTNIAPIIKGYVPDGISMDRLTNDISSASFTFRAKDTDSLHLNNFNDLSLTNYKTLPVLNVIPERAAHRNVFENDYERIEYPYGPRYINKKWEKAETIFNYSFLNMSKDDQYRIKALMNYSKGRLNEFWVPTWVRDMELKEDITTTETQLKMYYNNLVDGHKQSGYHIRIRLMDGTELFREILSFQESINTNEEIVVIDASLNLNISTDDIEIIDFIEKVRFDTDVFNLNFYSNEISQITLSMRSSI